MPSRARVPIRVDNQGARDAQTQTIFPTLLERTERQVEMLLSVVNRLENHCFTTPENPSRESDWQDCPPELAKKAESTAIAALSQLDNLLEDMSRWNAEGGALESSYNRYLENAAKLSEASLFEASQRVLPHIRYKATLVRLDLNDWVATYKTGAKDQVLGRGASPYDALRDFDKTFLNGVAPGGQILTLEVPPKAKKKKS